ncbi:MAG: hypothetical protein ABI162_15195 [Luteolibacter sp.]
MKSTIHKLTTSAFALFAAAAAIPEAHAAKLTLDGTGYCTIPGSEAYYPGGRLQSGRYTNLGADYYHTATIGIKAITNHSSTRSGSMSFELWAMRYYGATTGIVLMTEGLDTLKGGFHFSNVTVSHKAISLNVRRFPELDLFEYTSNGWKWKDVLTFSTKTLL